MDLRQMRYFVAVAEERHFGRAAERLHMSQPPLTRQIRALEESLDTLLFHRTPKGVELTEAGRVLLEEAPKVLAMAHRATERAEQAGKGRIGRLEVGIFGSGVLDVIPRMLARFHESRPDIRIALHNMTKAEQIEALRERRITVGFNRLVPPEPDLAVETVLRERLLVAVYRGHRLWDREALTLRDLDREPMILYPNLPIPGLAQRVAAAFQREKVRLEVAQEVEDVLTCVALVASGFGVAVTTESAATLKLPGVAYLPLRSRSLRDIELSCLYRKGDASPILAAFLDVIRSHPGRQAGAGGRRRPVPASD
jgi:LysR family transcriptional regulator, benzoate and cis,cis-muconate-responsive activator of ben and cat genes